MFRPVGQAELDLIEATGFQTFPPRLPIQPIFYPVLDQAYAEQIARDWNTRDAASGHVGYVTRFQVARPFVDRYEVQVVGASRHRELWVPAEELEEFNGHIVGAIEVICQFKA
ncbi:ADP-ribosylation/Crystallin J1 [Fimbriimonas ginsengisoli Gsoil 348]|uniref:ADP-ribosylation/Crystallin J1 n=1 Tax=Fimbriimonas ginsengisoli Gsoil 348 TaxID=661478 RepID=A0A068NV32_FIMGI|nr:ADP-ribosylation/Crystallin J1 [Fimbriimonas ginsengisoli Gsoil 348]